MTKTRDLADLGGGFIQAGTGAQQRTVESKLQDVVSVLDFIPESQHAAIKAGTSTYDATADIQAAINSCQTQGVTLIIPAGSYKLSRVGTTDLGAYGISDYAVKITAKLDIIADGAKFYSSVADGSQCINFLFESVDSSSFTGGYFEGTNTSGTTKDLHSGIAVAMSDCTACTVRDIETKNTRSSASAYSCRHCIIDNCTGYRTDYTLQSGTFFGCYSGSYNTISRCQTWGGCEDGDIFCYGSGYGNTIDGCRAFNVAYLDSTFSILSTNNQGLGLDASQDSGTVSNSIAYGHYYGIDAKGGSGQCKLINNLLVSNKIGLAARAGEVLQDVSGHILINGNVVLPRNGNGNATSVFGYTTLGLEVSRANSVSITNNYFGVDEAGSVGVTTAYNFASIVAVLDSASISVTQPATLKINSNTICHTQAFGSNVAYSTGPLLTVIGYWTGATNNKAEFINVTCNGNQFSPYNAANDGRIIKFDGLNSVTYNNNYHTDVGSALQTIPYVETNKVAKMSASSNSFSRTGTAFAHTFPTSIETGVQLLYSFIVNGNAFGRGLISTSADPLITCVGDGPCTVTSNTYWRADRTSGVANEGKTLTYNYTTTGALIFTNNIINGPQTSTTYYAVNGVDAATGANIIVSNIVNP